MLDSKTSELGSDRFVKFTLRQRLGKPLVTVIHHLASIYFCFWALVMTDQTMKSIVAVKVANGVVDDPKVYLNPSQDQLIVQWQEDRALSSPSAPLVC